MRGLTPAEFVELSRLLLPPGSRSVNEDSREHKLRDDLMEQGRASYEAYSWPVNRDGYLAYGCYDITAAGREALRLYPLMLALQAQP